MNGTWLLVVLLIACTPLTSPASTSRPPASTSAPSISSSAEDCPVTRPTTAPPSIGRALFGSGSAYGNEALWVGALGPGGVIAADPRMVQSDGSIDWKFGWWRIASGRLNITGRRLDGQAPPIRASVPEGYGDTGFQASGVLFPTEGCWEITGAVRDSMLRFVTLVRVVR